MFPLVAGTERAHHPVNRIEEHWDAIYRAHSPEALSWYAPHVASLDLIRESPKDAAIIDVGGGASTLVDDLLELGFRDLTVLDISETALGLAKGRLGDRAAGVEWIRADITSVHQLPKVFDIWHDRAVFHFLTLEAERRAYARLLRRSLKPGGRAIVLTFAPDGPAECSGLPVMRYDPQSLKQALGEPLEPRSFKRIIHVTPSGREQAFVLCEFVRALCG
jgi:SAM-dependent methyltransferase